MIRAQIKPKLLKWARERAGLSQKDLSSKFPKLHSWESGEIAPTLKQVESFAKATRAPVGYLFLSQPPVESLPIPDFRTMGSRGLTRPTPDLLETLYMCQQRQSWYKEYVRFSRERRHTFVGSVKVGSSVVEAAASIRQALKFDVEARRVCPTWTDALREFIAQADSAGILVMCSGVVLNNNRRRLDPKEFRGFALADELAPVVFINGADTKAAQMFTLAHELAHLWAGETALSDAPLDSLPSNAVERWCNEVAAELLVPMDVLRAEYDATSPVEEEKNRLARRFKVSTLVILRRFHDSGVLRIDAFRRAYDLELRKLTALSKGGGGDFYLTQAARVSKRFARALVESTLEGHTLYRDALRMLGIAKVETFHELGNNV
jgi:Zn-dependent peptidase ImmA (M78 family)/transcriptional regulator with XRE-family HTH domain